ncbi:acyltransferase, WS/DGAT/MGAT [Hydrocarboniphaga daqingensis]|uniref:diacylglycerol O-acyltransferase n=2 Tax=Hydrocarboniphaga daqingensis TaxID=490188 RepID=A0A1M5LE96_9GAMM|nr:acyltransferase, WS/DGAT/MGAT [Hydrocarboniphaga daqingensis]
MTRKMNPLDASWLFVDSQRTPMHVGALAIFSLPDDVSPDFIKNLFLHLRSPAGFVPPFNLRLKQPRLKLISSRLMPSWEEDPNIDLDYHLRHSALPQPGGERELGVLVSRLHSHPLDFARPLWECHIIEGLANSRFALYMKMHHSLVDGVGGMRMLSRLLSPDDTAMNLPPPWAVGTGEKKRIARDAGPSWQQLADQAREQARHVPSIGRAIADSWKETLQNTHPELGVPFRAPRSILNRKVSAQRRFATQYYDLARMRTLAKRAKVTLNDVFLGLCAMALRRYLLELNALPSEPLTAGLPVSVRPAGDPGAGNAISFIIANLHTHIADPLERLALIRDSTQKAKARFQTLPKEAITAYTSLFMAPFMLQLMTGMGGLMRPMFNVTISNVPGPDQTLYFNGARMDQMYPVSLLSHGQAINITVVSYAGQFNVGYTGCRDTLPHMQRMAVYTGEALVELEALLGINAS